MSRTQYPTSTTDTTELGQAIERYLRSKSKGTSDSGTYRSNAATALTQFREWLLVNNYAALDLLGDPVEGPTIIRQYSQHLADRVADGELSAASTRTYYQIISGFLSYAVRDGVLDRNSALTDRAREPLPVDEVERHQQFWKPEDRTRLLEYIDTRVVDASSNELLSVLRERAIVYTLAFTGVRGAEAFRSNKDNREARQGLRWRNVDMERGTMRVFGKSQTWETTPIPRQAQTAIVEYYEAYNPASDDWPVFPSNHRPSRYKAAFTGLTATATEGGHGLTEDEAKAVLDELGVDGVYREYNIAPPALTIGGARTIMERLCNDSAITIDGDYLKPHGARRGIGDEIYRKDRGLAQDLLRHRSLSTTKEAYSHIEAEERGQLVSDLLDLPSINRS